MKLLRLLVVPLLLMGMVITSAQETGESNDARDTEKHPFEIKVSGDTAEDFKLEFIAHYKVDQSNPTALVKSYAAYSDNRESARVAMEEVGQKWQEAVDESMAPAEKKLLTEKAFEALHSEGDEDESNFSQTREPIEVASETKSEDGVWVETTQEVETRSPDWQTGEMTTVNSVEKLRFQCVKGEDGKFRINAIQAWTQDWDNISEDGEPKMAWLNDSGMYIYLLYSMADQAAEEPEPIKQSTPRETALSLFNSLRPTKTQMQTTVGSKGMDKWLEVVGGMFTDDYKKAQDKKVSDWEKNASPAPELPEVESVSTSESGDESVVKFKQADEWAGGVELNLKKVGDVWKIDKAGYYEGAFDTEGNKVWKYVEQPDVYGHHLR